MVITETRKTWLATTFFSGNVISSIGLLRVIKSDLMNDTDVGVADVEWLFSALGSTYVPPAVGLEVTGKVISINSGTNISILLDCLSGQVCDIIPKNIILQGVVTTADNDTQAKEWLNLHMPIGSYVTLTPIGSAFIVTKGTENINNSLSAYLSSLPLVTPITGTTINARVTSIIDGDSFRATQVCAAGQLCVTTEFEVRLEGVSSGELAFPNGRTGKTWLSDKIPPGTIVKLIIKGSDPYGRQVCQVYYPDTVNINQLEILEGQGKVWNPEGESLEGKQIGIQMSGCKSSNAPISLLPTLELVGPVCNYIKAPPAETWFGYTVRNHGNAIWRGWLGVILHGTAGDYEFTGNPQYAQSVPTSAVDTTLYAKFVVPTNIGNLKTWDATLNSVS